MTAHPPTDARLNVSWQIGRFTLTAVNFGTFRLDGGAMFGVVPKVLWQSKHPTDEYNRIKMALRGLLIRGDGRTILVDTGFGDGRTSKFRDMFAYNAPEPAAAAALASASVRPEDVTDVILTHLHFDHGGGATSDKTGRPIPAFPNARYYLQTRQLEHARSRLERDKASYLPEDYEPLVEAKVVKLVDGNWDLTEGISCLVCDGHTPAMQLVKVNDGKDTLLFCADLIPLASQVALPWIMAYDLFPVTTLEEKKHILAQAARDNWTLFFEHDPVIAAGKVEKTEKGYALLPQTTYSA